MDQHDTGLGPDNGDDTTTGGPRGERRRFRGRRHHPGFGPFGSGPEHRHAHGGPGPLGLGEGDHEDGDRGSRGRGRGRGGPERRGGRGRAQRGDVRAATLLLLTEQPMHGYQLMQAMADRTRGAWRPSPGAIYPTINQLEDEGLVTVTVDGGRKLVALTDSGREFVAAGEVTDPFAELTAHHETSTDLRGVLEELHSAARQVARSGNEAQVQQAQQVLADARRSLYLILAGNPSAGA